MPSSNVRDTYPRCRPSRFSWPYDATTFAGRPVESLVCTKALLMLPGIRRANPPHFRESSTTRSAISFV